MTDLEKLVVQLKEENIRLWAEIKAKDEHISMFEQQLDAQALVFEQVYILNEQLELQKKQLQEQSYQLQEMNDEIVTQNEEIQQQSEEILTQRDALAETLEQLNIRNLDVTASIMYAKRIQTAIFPSSEQLQKLLPESFIFLKPRDIVSGDFYWFTSLNANQVFLAVCDCTGHGVPGAFMSLLGYEILERIFYNKLASDPAEVLKAMNESLHSLLINTNNTIQDGMDVAAVIIDFETKVLRYAGAMNPLYYVQDNLLNVIKGDKQPIGGSFKGNTERQFVTHEVTLSKKTSFYLCSDGYQDQFGGPHARKFMTKNLRALFGQIHTLPMPEQREVLKETLKSWQGSTKQTDDICIVGFEIQALLS